MTSPRRGLCEHLRKPYLTCKTVTGSLRLSAAWKEILRPSEDKKEILRQREQAKPIVQGINIAIRNN